MQRVLTVKSLPDSRQSDSGLSASAAFMADHLIEARAILSAKETSALAIHLPAAGPAHCDWRTSLARDLAREYAPKRVNVAGGSAGPQLDDLLAYLEGAPGVTGQYCQTHE